MIPKFRFFGKVNDGTTHMVLAESIDFKNGFIYYSYHSYTEEEGDHVYGDVIGFEDCVLMQSTGKMDSTGQVEVYAGDILYYPDQDEDNYGIIKFDKDTLAFVLDNGYERFVYGDYGMGKVIGNIYENPELVEGIND